MNSFRLVETAKHLSFGKKSFWYIFGPMLMSKIVFDGLPKNQQDIIMQAGAEMEAFGLEGARAEDAAIIDVFKSAKLGVYDFDEASLDKWKAIARETAWKDYASKSEGAARLLKLATEA
jgi:TRAP-type C4-dicarboxylate transport system substrate-binding protein